MSRGLLLDTHVWAWLGNGLLHPDEQLVARINEAGAQHALFLCAISLYELANAHKRGRLNLASRTLEDWLRVNLRTPGPRVLEITPEVVVQTTRLPDTFHGDPGDRLIASTAQVHGLTIVTHDKALLGFGRKGLYSVLKARQKRRQV